MGKLASSQLIPRHAKAGMPDAHHLSTPPSGGDMVDLNFYPEKHLEELLSVLDEEVPEGWSVRRLIVEMYAIKMALWGALWTVDDDGNVVPREGD
jgi:hypothetical protein